MSRTGHAVSLLDCGSQKNLAARRRDLHDRQIEPRTVVAQQHGRHLELGLRQGRSPRSRPRPSANRPRSHSDSSCPVPSTDRPHRGEPRQPRAASLPSSRRGRILLARLIRRPRLARAVCREVVSNKFSVQPR